MNVIMLVEPESAEYKEYKKALKKESTTIVKITHSKFGPLWVEFDDDCPVICVCKWRDDACLTGGQHFGQFNKFCELDPSDRPRGNKIDRLRLQYLLVRAAPNGWFDENATNRIIESWNDYTSEGECAKPPIDKIEVMP